MEKTMDLLAKIKAAKDAKHLSYQDIADITEKNGEAVSLSTVKRIFSKEASLEDFRYNQTIRPIVRAVLGKIDDEVDISSTEEGNTTIEAFKSLLNLKQSEYDKLLKRAEKLEADLYELQVESEYSKDNIEQDAQRKIDFLCDIIEELKGEIKWYKKAMLIAVGLFSFFDLAMVAFMFIDHFVLRI